MLRVTVAEFVSVAPLLTVNAPPVGAVMSTMKEGTVSWLLAFPAGSVTTTLQLE